MATEMDGRPGSLRRFLKKMAKRLEALDYSPTDYTFDRMASVERELAALKDRMRQLEASRDEPLDVPVMRRPAD